MRCNRLAPDLCGRVRTVDAARGRFVAKLLLCRFATGCDNELARVWLCLINSLVPWFVRSWIHCSLVQWFMRSLLHWFTESTGSLNHRFIGSWNHYFTHSLSHRFTNEALWFNDSHCLTDSSTHWLSHSLIHWVTDSLLQSVADSLIHFISLIHCIINALTHWLIHSLIERFTGSFGQLCMDSFMSCHWHLNHYFLNYWCTSQLPPFIVSALRKLFYRPSMSYNHFILPHLFETSAPAWAGHYLVVLYTAIPKTFEKQNAWKLGRHHTSHPGNTGFHTFGHFWDLLGTPFCSTLDWISGTMVNWWGIFIWQIQKMRNLNLLHHL